MTFRDAIYRLAELGHKPELEDSGYSDGSYHREWWKCDECHSVFIIEFWGGDWFGVAHPGKLEIYECNSRRRYYTKLPKLLSAPGCADNDSSLFVRAVLSECIVKPDSCKDLMIRHIIE